MSLPARDGRIRPQALPIVRDTRIKAHPKTVFGALWTDANYPGHDGSTVVYGYTRTQALGTRGQTARCAAVSHTMHCTATQLTPI